MPFKLLINYLYIEIHKIWKLYYLPPILKFVEFKQLWVQKSRKYDNLPAINYIGIFVQIYIYIFKAIVKKWSSPTKYCKRYLSHSKHLRCSLLIKFTVISHYCQPNSLSIQQNVANSQIQNIPISFVSLRDYPVELSSSTNSQ